MTCVKRPVKCVITAKNGLKVTGTNSCEHPQEVCPRSENEGYEKCETICKQAGHAEIVAIQEAKRQGINLKGSIANLYGHYHVCQPCAQALRDEGVILIIINVEP